LGLERAQWWIGPSQADGKVQSLKALDAWI
jgi:hypothetical protein